VFSVDTRGYSSLWSNDISGSGGLAKTGAGVLVMTGNNSYTGATVISGGKLVVNGSIADSALLTIGQEAALGGSGMVGNTLVYGLVQPGNSVGTLTVAGNYTQQAGSLLELELSPQGVTDKLVVTGDVDIQGGGLRVLGLRAAHLGRQYSFLESGGALSGAFDETNLDGLFIDLAASRGASAFSLSVERNATSFASFARTGNQRAMANAVESQGLSGKAYDEIVGIQDATVVPALYESLTGEIYASTQSALFDTGDLLRHTVLHRTRQALRDPMHSGRGAAAFSQAGVSNDRGMWGQVFGNWGRLGGGTQARALDRSLGGLALGGDFSLGEREGRQARAGLGFSYTNSTLRDDARLDRVRADGYHAMAYAGMQHGPWSFRGGLTQSWYQLDTRRTIDWTAHASSSSKRDAQVLQVFVEAARSIDLGGATLEPYAGLAQMWLRQSAFAEDNAVFGLQDAGRRDAVGFSTLGLRLGTDVATDKSGRLQLEVGLGWRHAFGDVTPTRQLRFTTGDAFKVVGAPLARNALLADVGLGWSVGRHTRVALNYAGQLAGHTRDHSAQASVRWAF
ncbi:MAG TPA: autotransporter domain-containing protein, partial [Pusillimonas sp.]|uniref:autotransporter outer membrane beta-barrel domain-containing protein n=1 Tax=Pusillimonas sp. TaxID=3040095 RepID=UPI002D1B376B